MNILISSAGRRGALVRLCQTAVQPAGGKVLAVDAGRWSAACRIADGWAQVPRCTEESFVDVVAQFCRRRDVGLLIPTIDTELPILSAHRGRFEGMGVTPVVSGPETIAIGCDKLTTHRFLVQAGLPAVRQFENDELRASESLPYPLILKPRYGSASQGVHRVDDPEALQFYLRRTREPIVQELAQGDEYTVNCYVDRAGRLAAAVPHLRVETRGGEVSKCVTVRHDRLIEVAHRLVEALPDVWGPFCFQAFVAGDLVRIIELNPRFGGGYPICHHAGADFIGLLLEESEGGGRTSRDELTWREGVVMTRWDDAVFTNAADVGFAFQEKDRRWAA